MSQSLVTATSEQIVSNRDDELLLLSLPTRRQRSSESNGIEKNVENDGVGSEILFSVSEQHNNSNKKNKNLEQDRKRSNFNRKKKENHRQISKIADEASDERKSHQTSLRCLICFEKAKEITSIVPKQISIKNPSLNNRSKKDEVSCCGQTSFAIETHFEGLICNNTNRKCIDDDNDDAVAADDENQRNAEQHYFCPSCLSNDILLRWSKIEHEPGKIPEFFCPIPGCILQNCDNKLQKQFHDENNNNDNGMMMIMMGPKQKSEITIDDEDDDKDEDRNEVPPPSISSENEQDTTDNSTTTSTTTTFSLASIFFSLNNNNNNQDPSSSQIKQTSIPFTAIQIAKHCSEAAFLQYHQLRQNCRDAIILGAATDLAQSSIQQNRKSGDKLLLAAQLQLQFGSKAIMCPKCKLMTTWVECSDLKRHNGEVYRGRRNNNNNNNNNNVDDVVVDPNLRNVTAQTDNACKHCRFFTKYRAKWMPWDGILRDEDELLAAKDSWKDKDVDGDDESDSDDEDQDGQNNNNNNNQNRAVPVVRLTEEQKVQNFIDWSGTDEATAITWLQRHGGDFDRAINAFLDNNR